MGNDKKDDDRCVLCRKSFGFLTPRKECALCHRAVCAKCAPHRDAAGAVAGGGKPPRVCDGCHATPAPAPPAPRDAQTEEERQKRVAAIEARRGKQQQQPAAARAPPAATPSPPAPPQATQAPETPPPARAEAGANPVLEAALRRQQMAQAHGGGGAARPATVEKARLLREIEALLARHNDVPPFGLKSSDEAKLRSYLQYVKEKYAE
ncbi:hypothetical protein STCU_04588 [Strigomonas culicis]|uniref:FYVE-type domain-containing protein n=1 Tax=Strigomonas culicis TaxID=28005 RepID=S9UKS4_9TRYP|nr:hypothetical protein STCU_04588 [Strigomonas culicis]|eukprot:EPY29374.1 hypothetical protein STCU_04588 [Strigomonas culicis]